MVNVSKGSLITCDAAVKQYLIHLDETNEFGMKFILHHLDENHLFVATSAVPLIKERLNKLMDSISYDLGETR
ncbi:unnamed protein product [Didymodactylos carnosus]|uniref:General transcription and DNA repair factor IIH subunit TFB5 n=1 Tax=Didymodactylos carnosus TaxID=1234261 RepID=A0A814TN74_9BILA|nr:unnamed protein product [Didymodactylos carnosus]CAF1163116.1 unnamed protein product [Didymodactylos carnosus]CAF3701718.1 unnamed protein product [Didymodactylos carnosus]CAF3926686.1 unnamed protein product [Didymodactylos carnosus]